MKSRMRNLRFLLWTRTAYRTGLARCNIWPACRVGSAPAMPSPALLHSAFKRAVPAFPGTGKLSLDKGFQRLQPVLETLYFAISAIRKWQSLTHGPEDRVTGEQPEIRAVRQRIGAVGSSRDTVLRTVRATFGQPRSSDLQKKPARSGGRPEDRVTMEFMVEIHASERFPEIRARPSNFRICPPLDLPPNLP